MKNGYIFVFSADDNKELATVWEKNLSPPKIFLKFFSEKGMINSVCSCHSRDTEGRNIKKLLSQQ